MTSSMSGWGKMMTKNMTSKNMMTMKMSPTNNMTKMMGGSNMTKMKMGSNMAGWGNMKGWGQMKMGPSNSSCDNGESPKFASCKQHVSGFH